MFNQNSHAKTHIRRLWGIRILALFAFTLTILGSCYSESNAAVVKPTNCMYTGYTNAWGTEDENIDLQSLFDDYAWYPTRQCWVGGARIYHTAANNHFEVVELKNMFLRSAYGKRFGIPMVFCQPAKNEAYLMSERWVFSQISKPTPAQLRNWNRFAKDWVQAHEDCKLGK